MNAEWKQRQPKPIEDQARTLESLTNALWGGQPTTPAHTLERTPASGLGMRIAIIIMVAAAKWS